jgi:hypothetical protein
MTLSVSAQSHFKTKRIQKQLSNTWYNCYGDTCDLWPWKYLLRHILRPNSSKDTSPTCGIIALLAHVISNLVSICSVTFKTQRIQKHFSNMWYNCTGGTCDLLTLSVSAQSRFKTKRIQKHFSNTWYDCSGCTCDLWPFQYLLSHILRPNWSKNNSPTRGIITMVAHVISDLVSICSVTF